MNPPLIVTRMIAALLVEIRHIERTIGTHLDINWSAPGITAFQRVAQVTRLKRGTLGRNLTVNHVAL